MATETITKSQSIKAKLRALGYKQSQVSVKEDPCGLSWCFHFTIRDPKVELFKIAEFVTTIQEIDKCNITHEIMSGGNTFVHIHLTDKVKDAWNLTYKESYNEETPSLDKHRFYCKLSESLTVLRYIDEPHDHIILTDSSSPRKSVTIKSRDFTHVRVKMHILQECKFDLDVYYRAIRNVDFH